MDRDVSLEEVLVKYVIYYLSGVFLYIFYLYRKNRLHEIYV